MRVERYKIDGKKMEEKVIKKRRVKRGWMNLKVTKIFEDNPSTKTLYLEDAEEGGVQFDYNPGQYLTLRFDSLAEKPVVRSYTMSSSPCEKKAVALTVREVEDPFVSRSLCRDYKVGDVIRARGPIGRFCYEPEKDHKHLVMVAGGSGVTPFVSIAREFAPSLGQPGSPEELTLFVTFRSDKELMCWETIKNLQGKDNIQIVVTLSRQEQLPEGSSFVKGRVNEALMDEVLQGSYEGKTFMTCGPTALMNMMTSHVRSKGVAEEYIKQESFD